MENKISVQEFVNKYKKLNSETAKMNYINSVIVNDYVSYSLKELLAKKIVENTSYARDENMQMTSNIKINSIQRYIVFIFTLISQYTCIVMDQDNLIADFDELDRNGLIDVLVAAMPESEVKKFNTILDMALQDFMQNNYETHVYISKQVDKVVNGVKQIADAALPEIMKSLDSEDIKTLLGALKELKK